MSTCEICKGDFEFLNGHHIISKCYGGLDNSHNIANICPNCHTTVHHGKIIIEGRFVTSRGSMLI